MSWTSADDLKAQVRRLWERGELLRSMAGGCEGIAPTVVPVGQEGVSIGLRAGCSFPLRLAMKGPTSTELAERFQAVREWIAGMVGAPHIRIEWREFNHRVLGPQRVPQTVWLDDLDSALGMIGKRADAARFRRLLDQVGLHRPALLPWFLQRPLQALELADECECLMAVVDWIAQHPRPGIYLRQVDIAGVHSKFIERRRGVLTEWLDLVLPIEVISADRSGSAQFAARYGFLEKPVRIRFRVLDASLPILRGAALPDISVDADSFAALNLPVRRVFITENETNLLAFPPIANAIVVFGAGYGWDALSKAAWLSRCCIHYWGDIDTHGFAILDQLRSRFGHVESLLMDRATLMEHEAVWGQEADQVLRDLPRLDHAERALFDELRHNRLRSNLRLEQEHVRFRWVETALALFA
ncbi:Wadjet anti-phage system protein JetD domain-containing protein [Paraburkholderia terrae]